MMTPELITIKLNPDGKYIGASVRMSDGELVPMGKGVTLAKLLESVDEKDLRKLHKACEQRVNHLDGIKKKPWYKW